MIQEYMNKIKENIVIEFNSLDLKFVKSLSWDHFPRMESYCEFDHTSPESIRINGIELTDFSDTIYSQNEDEISRVIDFYNSFKKEDLEIFGLQKKITITKEKMQISPR